MRALLLACIAVAAPHTGQEHGAHVDHDMPANPQPDAEPADPGAKETGHRAMDHGDMAHAIEVRDAPPPSGPPRRAFEGPEHAADAVYGAGTMALAREALARENGEFSSGTLMLERLEALISSGNDHYLWDVQGWYGGDIDKLWLKSEGEGAFGGEVEGAEIQALWSHATGPWFDVQAGARYDFAPDGRAHAVLGLQGLAPYMFEIDAAAFLSDKGNLTARIEAEYDQRLTQRLILQPRVELNLSAQDVAGRDQGAGLTSIEAGLRLRYEIVREIAPYVGVGYEAKMGETADLARAKGGDPSDIVFVFGVREWF